MGVGGGGVINLTMFGVSCHLCVECHICTILLLDCGIDDHRCKKVLACREEDPTFVQIRNFC